MFIEDFVPKKLVIVQKVFTPLFFLNVLYKAENLSAESSRPRKKYALFLSAKRSEKCANKLEALTQQRTGLLESDM